MNFSELSQSRLRTCDQNLVIVANKAIIDSPYDFMISFGHRSPAIQLDLYKKGREYIDGKWVVTEPKKVVTHRDGLKVKSKHNYNPSLAFDIAILVEGKVTWDVKYYKIVADHILKVSKQLFDEGKINRIVKWGGDFRSFPDFPHYEI
jgi:peptidoglycan L-alanyl-D-glutamate endopeptidase CwlK